MLDDLRNYVQLASGLTEATTSKAKDVVTSLLAHGFSLGARAMPDPQVVGQVQDLAEELVTTSKANREVLTGLIRSEVDKAVARMGFVREDELAALRRHVERLEAELAEVQAATVAQPAMSVPGDAGLVESVVPEVVVPEVVVPEVVVPEPESPQADTATEPVVKRKKKILVQPEAGS
jgi:polyhydroxyalkanoate synthesis regulator phasin